MDGLPVERLRSSIHHKLRLLDRDLNVLKFLQGWIKREGLSG